jgi:hypothetical protein
MKTYCCMKRLLACLLLLSLPPAVGQQSLFSDIGTIQQGLAEITGFRFTRPVPYSSINKEQLRAYLEQRIKHSIKPSDLRAEELMLKLLGLVPADYDLRQSTIDLLTEQAAAFYDYDKRKLFVLEGPGASADTHMALVHELAHALADQYFHLGRFIHEGLRSDDSSTARLAVMEGQASWLMTAYLSKESGGPADVADAALDLMTQTLEGASAQYPVFSNAPLYIRESLVFPYSRGMLFQNAVYRKLGRASFSEVFLRPPVSTQQILHPERYLARRVPFIPAMPRVPDSREFRTLTEGTLGELDYRILLSQYAGKETGEALASHLTGGFYKLLEHKRHKTPAIVFVSQWDTEESARQCLEQYRRVLRGKWKTLEFQPDMPSRLEGRGDTGFFRAWVEGSTVNHIEGWQSPLK